MEITLAQLKKLKACEDQVKLFKETFGKSLVLTEAVCREHAGKFNIGWLAGKLLKGKAYKQYLSIQLQAWGQFESIQQPAYEQYLSIAQQTWEQYRITIALALMKLVG